MLFSTQATRQDKLRVTEPVWQADTEESVIKAVMGSPLPPHLQVDQYSSPYWVFNAVALCGEMTVCLSVNVCERERDLSVCVCVCVCVIGMFCAHFSQLSWSENWCNKNLRHFRQATARHCWVQSPSDILLSNRKIKITSLPPFPADHCFPQGFTVDMPLKIHWDLVIL